MGELVQGDRDPFAAIGRRRRGLNDGSLPRCAAADDLPTIDRAVPRQLLRHVRASLQRAETSRPSSPSSRPRPGPARSPIRASPSGIAEVDGELVGYVKLGPARACRSSRAARPLELDQFYVLKAATGTGIARRADGLGDRRGHGSAARASSTSPSSSTIIARARFYERYGFDAVGPYEFMVGDQADEDIIMRQAL